LHKPPAPAAVAAACTSRTWLAEQHTLRCSEARQRTRKESAVLEVPSPAYHLMTRALYAICIPFKDYRKSWNRPCCPLARVASSVHCRGTNQVKQGDHFLKTPPLAVSLLFTPVWSLHFTASKHVKVAAHDNAVSHIRVGQEVFLNTYNDLKRHERR
jgi:hypothetical protein